MPSELFGRLHRILPLADKVADEIVYEEINILEKIVPRMLEVMHTTVKFLCDYVKRGRFGRQPTFSGFGNADDHRENEGRAHSFEGQRNDRANSQRVD